MKWVFLVAAVLSSAFVGSNAAERVVQIDPKPFTPPLELVFDSNDGFVHPKEVVAPKLLWPFEYRRADSARTGKVIVLVQLDHQGFASRLSVYAGDDELFIRSALAALQKARWESGHAGRWFFYRAVFDLEAWEKEPNQ